jgi:ferrochelatase
MTVSCHLSEGLEDLDKSTSKALAISCSGSSDKRNGLVGRSSHCSPIEKRNPVGQTFCSVGVCTYGEADIGSNSHIREEKVGVLLLNLGGPETLDDVQPFLFNLFADPVCYCFCITNCFCMSRCLSLWAILMVFML